MGVSKVKLNGKTLVDLTDDTVDRHNLPQGVTAHNAAGEQVTGEFTVDDMIPGFTEAGKRENIKSGEKVSVILGKIAKWFSDLKPAAFLSPTNNLLANIAGTALDAVQGAVLKGLWDQHETKINKINSDLNWKGLGPTSGDGIIDLPDHKELWVLISFQSKLNLSRALHIARTLSFEADLFGVVNGEIDFVHIFYHVSSIGMMSTSNAFGTKNFAMRVYYR